MIKRSATAILGLLSGGGAYSLHELAEKTGFTVPAVKNTVEELEGEYGLLSVSKRGREKQVSLNRIPPTRYLLKFIEWYSLPGLDLPEAYKKGIVMLKNEACSVFGKDLFSIVLFGSQAKGTASYSESKRSDMDILLVLSKKDEKLEKLIIEEKALRKTGVDVHLTCFTPAMLLENARSLSPILLEIYAAHHTLYDRTGVFRESMETLKKYIKYRKAHYDEARRHWVIGIEA